MSNVFQKVKNWLKQDNEQPGKPSISEDILNDLPFIPNEAPFSDDQRFWISGFVAGIKQQESLQNKTVEENSSVAKTLVHFLFGTQTGNAETVAEDAAQAARSRGCETKVKALDDVSMDDLEKMEKVVVAVSTYGEGEMPDNAELFWEALSASTAPKLDKLQFGVIALGDTGYDQFCNAGKLIDTRFEQLGAKRLLDRIDCDVDYEESTEAWVSNFLPLISDGEIKKIEENKIDKKSEWTRKNPYPAKVLLNKLMSGKNSQKEIRHYEIDLDDSNISYEVGDALGVMPVNDLNLVKLIIKRIGSKNNFIPSNKDVSLEHLLTYEYEISTPSKEFILEISNKIKNKELSNLISSENKEGLESFLWGKDILDLLNVDMNLKINADDFVKLLKPLQHRAYSISSSLKAHSNQVHLTVSSVRWENENREHKGVCSTFLADRYDPKNKVGIFVSQNKAFRLPENKSLPVIMVGPGTGVAPFRAFLEERENTEATGKNWLFFGDQTYKDDFIYKTELTNMQKKGLIDKLDLAFSRDQKEKIYVQHRMLESGKELYEWLESGAYFYVCGDATKMAKDVDQALHTLIQKHGNLNTAKAVEYVKNLKKEKRYLRDVY